MICHHGPFVDDAKQATHTYDTCEPGLTFTGTTLGKSGWRDYGPYNQFLTLLWVPEEQLPPTLPGVPFPSPLNFARKQSPWICYLGLSWNKHSHYPNLMQSSKEVLIRRKTTQLNCLAPKEAEWIITPTLGACPVLAPRPPSSRCLRWRWQSCHAHFTGKDAVEQDSWGASLTSHRQQMGTHPVKSTPGSPPTFHFTSPGELHRRLTISSADDSTGRRALWEGVGMGATGLSHACRDRSSPLPSSARMVPLVLCSQAPLTQSLAQTPLVEAATQKGDAACPRPHYLPIEEQMQD